MNIKFYHEKNLPPYQYIILISKEGKRLTWESGPQYKNRWRYRPNGVAITKYSEEIDSSEFPIDKKREAIAVLFDSKIGEA